MNLGKFQLGTAREIIFILPDNVLVYAGKENAGELESVSHLTNTYPSVGSAQRWHRLCWKDGERVDAFQHTSMSV